MRYESLPRNCSIPWYSFSLCESFSLLHLRGYGHVGLGRNLARWKLGISALKSAIVFCFHVSWLVPFEVTAESTTFLFTSQSPCENGRVPAVATLDADSHGEDQKFSYHSVQRAWKDTWPIVPRFRNSILHVRSRELTYSCEISR